jgi:hypothetical protein
MNQTTDTKTSVEIVDCDDYVEDQRICYGGGEPKGQCVNCGFMWFNHRLELMPEEDRAAAERIQKGKMNMDEIKVESANSTPVAQAQELFIPPPPCSASWLSIETPPDRAGTFILGNTSSGEVGQARWMPRKSEWKFPSAHMAFRADVWTSFPSPNIALSNSKQDSKGGA